MEPATIAIAAVTFLAGGIAGGGLEEIGKDIYGKIKNRFKPDEIIKLDLMEKYPEVKELQGEVTEVLTKHLEASPEFSNELAELVKRIPASQIKQNTMNIKGDGTIALQDVSKSDIEINR
jgi:hypothetical protein